MMEGDIPRNGNEMKVDVAILRLKKKKSNKKQKGS